MPGYRSHLLGGFVTYLAIIQAIAWYNPSHMTVIQGFLFCLLGSLFPDIDVKSKGQNVFYTILLVLMVLLLYKQQYCLFAVVSLLGVIPMLVKHRGIFHHIWFLLLLSIIGTGIVKMWCGYFAVVMVNNSWFFFAGAVSHVVLDKTVTAIKRAF